jgi:hypothetical protein
MRFGWVSLFAAAIAQPLPLAAQRVGEIGLHTVVTTGEPTFWGGGAYAALRPSQRLRLAATIAGGVAGVSAAGRGELLGHFLLNPAGRGGAAFYAGGGVAGVVGPVDEGYLVLLLGLEARPGAFHGWSLEVGVGAGMRVAAGYRWRRVPA